MTTSIMLAPAPNRSYVCSSGNVYASDQFAIITGVSLAADVTSLIAAGCALLTPPPTDLLGKLLSANFNTTADQLIPLGINVKYRVKRIVVLNTSVNGMNTAAGGLYTAAAKAGSAIVAAGQVYTGLTNALTALELTLALPTLVLAAATPLYLSLTTAQGAAATADIYVYGDTYT